MNFMECASFWKLCLLVIALVHDSRIHLTSEAAAGISVSLSVRAHACTHSSTLPTLTKTNTSIRLPK